MIGFLSKKISLPGEFGKPTCIDWGSYWEGGGHLIIGGEKSAKAIKFSPDNGTLTENSTLDEQSDISMISWNVQERKVILGSSKGTTTVFVQQSGQWVEEMVNELNEPMACAKWSRDGSMVILGYYTGNLICGGVGGERKWGKKLEREIGNGAWSPDSQLIALQYLTEREIAVLQVSDGEEVGRYPIKERKAVMIDMIWADIDSPTCRALNLVFSNGKVHKLIGPSDKDPFIFDTGLRDVTAAGMNSKQTLLAVGGKTEAGNIMAKIFDYQGSLLLSLKLVGSTFSSLSFNELGTQIAFACDNYIYFANIVDVNRRVSHHCLDYAHRLMQKQPLLEEKLEEVEKE